MQIAVTGGSGRIGRAVIEMALAQGHAVVGLDRVLPGAEAAHAGASYLQVDTSDYAAVEGALRGCDALVHLAAIPSPRGLPDHVVHNNNVVGSYNVLSAAAALGIKRIAQASSVNAVGAAYSRWPRFDYFPLDEAHPTYNEDPYSLSKWICEAQGDSLARRHEGLRIASLRFHWVVPDLAMIAQRRGDFAKLLAKHLWGYTLLDAAARACLQSLTAEFVGHEAFFINAPNTMEERPSLELAREFFPDVPVRGDLGGTRAFFTCEKAERLLGWVHDERTD